MKKVRFYDRVEDSLLRFAVIIAKSGDQWVFCKHRERDTYEVPGGHREPGEDIEAAARRELYEETGALVYTLTPICVYSVSDSEEPDGRESLDVSHPNTDQRNITGQPVICRSEESFGMLYFARIESFEPELHSEIEKIILTEELPDQWTYPEIQPKLLAEAHRRGIL